MEINLSLLFFSNFFYIVREMKLCDFNKSRQSEFNPFYIFTAI